MQDPGAAVGIVQVDNDSAEQKGGGFLTEHDP